MAAACSSPSDCFNHGDCQEDRCSCDFGWFGKICDQPGTATWGIDLWIAFNVIYAFLFAVLLVLSGWKLYVSIKANNWMLGRVRKVIGSPKHLAILFISMHAVLRIFWLSIDPLRQYDSATRLSDRLMFESAYPLVYSTFSCVLLVWGGLHQGVARLKSDKTRLFRWVLFIAMLLSFPTCLAISFIKGMRVNQRDFRVVGYALICCGVVIIMTGLVIFGRKLMRIAKELEEKEVEEGKLLEDSTRGVTGNMDLTSLQPVISLDKAENEQNNGETPTFYSLDTVYRIRPRPSLSSSYPPYSDDNSSVSEAWHLSSVSTIRSADSIPNWSCLSTTHLESLHNRPSTLLPAVPRQSKDYLVVLTSDDQAVLKQVRAP